MIKTALVIKVRRPRGNGRALCVRHHFLGITGIRHFIKHRAISLRQFIHKFVLNATLAAAPRVLRLNLKEDIRKFDRAHVGVGGTA